MELPYMTNRLLRTSLWPAAFVDGSTADDPIVHD